MKRDFTATVFILEQERVLLLWHRKVERWLPPGGHLEPNEAPWEAAIREAREETGLEVELISDASLRIRTPNAACAPRPFLQLLEEIPSYGEDPAHQHIDSVFLAKAKGGALCESSAESNGLRWFTLEEVESLCDQRETLPDVKQIVRHLLGKTS